MYNENSETKESKLTSKRKGKQKQRIHKTGISNDL